MDYTYFKLVHLFAVLLFLGNIITGLFWMRQAFKTRNLLIITHTIQVVIRSDRLFTIPGVVLITIGGLMSAIHGQIPILDTGWIFWSIVLFTISGIAFMWKVAPLQKKMYRLSIGSASLDDGAWMQIHQAHKSWEVWGLIALLTPLLAFCMMVLKIPR